MGPKRIATLAVLVVAHDGAASADSRSAALSVVSLFTIAKSENKNQVQYGVRVDADCVPAADNPIVAYWRMFEKGPARTEPLLSRELAAYGVESQVVVARNADGGSIRLVLRAVPSRPILVETSHAPGGACRALATIPIAGAPAYLFNVYAHLRWPFGLDYLLLQGWSKDGTRLLKEKLEGQG
jgi:hypothetical protein